MDFILGFVLPLHVLPVSRPTFCCHVVVESFKTFHSHCRSCSLCC